MGEEDWVKVQVKTFTKWCNSHLSKRNMQISDLKTGFQDGVMLINLLEVIGNESLGEYNPKPKIKMAKIENLNISLEYIKTRKVQLHSMGATDIFDGNLKMILGMLWTLILRFQISDISVQELTAKEALLLWCKMKTEGYDGVSVKDFTWSFQNGLAFCALINRHRPDLIDYKSLDKEKQEENLHKAFIVAEKELGIPKYLEVEDMVGVKPDERSVMTYLSEYFKCFSKGAKSEKAGKIIGNSLLNRKKLEDSEKEYIVNAEELIKLIKQHTSELSFLKFQNTPEDIKVKLADYIEFKKVTKPAILLKKFELRVLLDSIQFKRVQLQMKVYMPQRELNFETIDDLWEMLISNEKQRSEKLIAEHIRQNELQRLYDRYQSMKIEVLNYFDEVRKYLSEKCFTDSISDALRMQKIYDLKLNEFNMHKKKMVNFDAISTLIVTKNHHKSDDVYSETTKILTVQKEEIEEELKVKGNRLARELEHQNKVDTLRLNFAKRAKEYVFWKKSSEEAVENISIGNDIDTVRSSSDTLFKWIEKQKERSKKRIDALIEMDVELVSSGSTKNDYTPLTIDQLKEMSEHLEKVFSLKKTDCYSEIHKQEEIDSARQEFATCAQDFNKLVEENQLFFSKLLETESNPSESISKIQTSFDSRKFEDLFMLLEEKNKKCKTLHINENKYTVWSFENLMKKRGIVMKQYEEALTFLKQEVEFASQQERLNQENAEREKNISNVFELGNTIENNSNKVRECIDFMKKQIFAENILELDEISTNFTTMKSAAEAAIPIIESSIQGYEVLRTKIQQDYYRVDTKLANEQNLVFKKNLAEYEIKLNQTKEKITEVTNQMLEHAEMCNSLKKQLEDISTRMIFKDNLEEEFANVEKLLSHTETISSSLIEIEKFETQLQENGFFVDQTKTNYNELASFYKEIYDVLKKKRSSIENEIIAIKGSKISDSQLTEFKRLFKLFDKDKKDALFQYELSAVINTLGDEISNEELTDVFNKYDTNKSGTIGFKEFVSFMTSRIEETNTKEQHLQYWKTIAGGQEFVSLSQMKKAGLSQEIISFFISKCPLIPNSTDCYDYKAINDF